MEWQPIETAPKDGTKVLIVDKRGEIDVARYLERWVERQVFVRKSKDGDFYRTEREECGFWESDISDYPTHWMPLPAPPIANHGG